MSNRVPVEDCSRTGLAYEVRGDGGRAGRRLDAIYITRLEAKIPLLELARTTVRRLRERQEAP